jgi:hypothetical protein
MSTPTATIYVPYHAVDELILRGPRASQPAASAVVPGTLYAVTDENRIERSTGTAWELYGPTPSGLSGTAEYTFSSATTEPPATREVRFNAASPYTTVTLIWPRVVTATGVDLRAAFAAQPAGVTIYAQEQDDATRWAKFTTGAVGIDKGDYFEFPVTPVDHGAALTNNQTVVLAFAGGGGGGSGDVVGPASAVDHSVALYSGTTGKVITDASQVTVDAATGNLTTPGSLTAGGLSTTPLNASNLTSGTVANARLSAQVARTDAANTFTVAQTINSATNASLMLTDANQGTDAKKFRILNGSQQLRIDALNDAESTFIATPLILNRTGTLIVGTDLYEKQRTTPMGHWIDVPFNAANFTAPAGMTWTVAAGNVHANRYTLLGKTLIWQFDIQQSAVSGTMGASIYATTPIPTSGFEYNGAVSRMYSEGTFDPGASLFVDAPNRVTIVRTGFAAYAAGRLDVLFTVIIPVL